MIRGSGKSRLSLVALAVSFLLLFPAPARGQVPPTPGAPPGTLDEEKPEGVAEKAPEEPGQLPTVPVLPPWPGQTRKKLQVFELDGYFRTRFDWFSKLHLGFHDLGQGTPFPESLSCLEGSSQLAGCSDSIHTWNMRLRLTPTLNVSEEVAVKLIVDVLDNVVLGATPSGRRFDDAARPGDTPVDVFSESQVPPENEENWAWDSIRAKAAWAEVMTPLGMLRFGRMPKHWGLGILDNAGGRDPFTGLVCLDCDYGDSGDRVTFSTTIPGTPLSFTFGREWQATGPTSAQTGHGVRSERGQPFDLEDEDDLTQWIFVLARLDAADDWNDKVERGDLALNYGIYVLRRHQSVETVGATLDRDPADPATGPQTLLQTRDASLWIPDLYVQLGYKNFRFAAEAVAVWGDLNLSDQVDGLTEADVRAFGGVARGAVDLLDGDLTLGLEAGFATGDQWEGRQGVTNVRDKGFLPDPTQNVTIDDTTISNFRFDYDYHVDLILFRELLGAVANAWYLKPSLSYDVTDRIRFQAQVVSAFALEPVATPGNDSFYGIELDGDLGYHNEDEGFFAGVSYGVLFPMGALDRPVTLFPGANEGGDAETAQTFQARLVVTF